MRNKLWIGHLGFVLHGVANTTLGPILPVLSLRWALDDVHAGQLFTAQFLGAVIGTVLSSRLMIWLGCRRAAALGMLFLATGLATIGVSGPIAAKACVFCLGLGIGVSVTPINLWITLAEPERSAAAANLLNASWCIGAATSAPIITFLVLRTNLTHILDVISILLLLMAALLAAEREPLPPFPAPVDPSEAIAKSRSATRRLFILLISAMIFVYVGTESGVGGWVTTYANRLSLLPAGSMGFAQSTFFGALLIGRVAAPFILKRIKGSNLVLLSAGVSVVGMSLSVIASQSAPVLAGLFIAGIGFAAIFPTTVATFSDRLGAESMRLAGWIFPLGYVGAALVPFAMGAASDKFHGLRFGMAVALACALILCAIQFEIIRLLRRGPAAS
ncbi:MAG TPA: MFS transporter [Candidatus Acidoferrales bacterium]